MSEAPGDPSPSAAPTGTAVPPPPGGAALPISAYPLGVPLGSMGPQAQVPHPLGAPLPPGWRHVPGRPGWITPVAPRPLPVQRFWPRPPGAASTAALAAVGVAAIVGAIALVPSRPGLGWLLSGIALAAVGLVATLRRTAPVPAAAPAPDSPPDDSPPEDSPRPEAGTTPAASTAVPKVSETVDAPAAEPAIAPGAAASAEAAAPGGVMAFVVRYGERVFWAAITLALLSVGTFRAAGWLYFWCVLAAIGTAAFGLAGGRTVKAMTLGVFIGIGSTFVSLPWLGRAWQRSRRTRATIPRGLIVALVSIALVLVFGGLFAGADAEFRHLVVSITPRLDAAEVARGVFCFALVGLIGGGVAYLASVRPALDSMTPTRWRSVRRFEWVVPLAILNVLFAVFDVVQLAVFFSPDRSLTTRSHAYLRGYAHEGFWQLLAVTILTLTVLGVTARIAPRDQRADRVWLRVLLGGMAVLSLVIVAAALKRLSTYEAVYGFTQLRVVAGGVALWLGVVFIFVLVASMLLRAGWLPRVIAGSLAVALFAGALANPDLYIAQHNIDRYHRIGKLSLSYMATLSTDAAPAMAQLTQAQRQCAGWLIKLNLENNPDDWRTFNTARENARKVLSDVTTDEPDRSCDIR